jgi:hypothetical protein
VNVWTVLTVLWCPGLALGAYVLLLALSMVERPTALTLLGSGVSGGVCIVSFIAGANAAYSIWGALK